MQVTWHGERIDEDHTTRISRKTQPKLFAVIEGSSKSPLFQAHDWTVEKLDMDTIEIRHYHHASGNGKYEIELVGWEMVALLEMLVPTPDNDLQAELKKKLQNAVGLTLFSVFSKLNDEQSEFKRVVKFELKPPTTVQITIKPVEQTT